MGKAQAGLSGTRRVPLVAVPRKLIFSLRQAHEFAAYPGNSHFSPPGHRISAILACFTPETLSFPPLGTKQEDFS